MMIDTSNKRLLPLVANNFPVTAPVIAPSPPVAVGSSSVDSVVVIVGIVCSGSFISSISGTLTSFEISHDLLVAGTLDSSGHSVL